jgi:hypothetical protein
MAKETILGKVVSTSKPLMQKITKSVKIDFYTIEIRELVKIKNPVTGQIAWFPKGRKIVARLSTSAIGLTGKQGGKIFVLNRKTKTWMKHQMVTPGRLVDQKVAIRGETRPQGEGLYMDYVEWVKVF